MLTVLYTFKNTYTYTYKYYVHVRTMQKKMLQSQFNDKTVNKTTTTKKKHQLETLEGDNQYC